MNLPKIVIILSICLLLPSKVVKLKTDSTKVDPAPSPKQKKTGPFQKQEKKPKVLHFRSLEDFENLKLFNSDYGKTKIRIGILGMPVHKNMRKFLRRKGFKGLAKDLIYKQERVRDESQSQVSWHMKESRRIVKYLDKNIRRYAYYPTSYAKALFGWNIFDYLVQKDGDSLVILTR